MLREAAAVDRALASARRRAAATAALRGAALGALVAAAGSAVLLLVNTALAGAWAAAAIGGAASAWWIRARRRSDREIASAIEARTPAFRNALVTAIELRAHPDRAPAVIADRVARDAGTIADRIDASALFPLRGAALRTVIAAVPLLALATVVLARPDLVERARSRASNRFSTARAQTDRGTTLSVEATVTRPAYTRLPPLVLGNPERIEAIEGSHVALAIASSAPSIRVRTDRGEIRALVRGSDGIFRTDFGLRTGYLALEGENVVDRRLVTLVAVPDAAPIVRITAPGRDLLYPDSARPIAFALSATDDLALRSLTLHYTKVTGSGENFAFTEGDLPIEVAQRDPRTWDGRAHASLAALGLAPGDTLVYRASASDLRPGGTGVSDTYVIEIGKAAEGLAEGFAIGDEENKYALSQRMVLLKTERLDAKRGSMAPDAFTSEAAAIAAEQRMVRAEFVFMMGGEVEDEEVEAEHSNELQEGRLENRGQRELRTAIRLMSDAEHQLIAADTARALPIERSAIAALEGAFSRNRYILRTLAAQSRIELSRRLSGDRSTAAGWTRAVQAQASTIGVPAVRAVLDETLLLAASSAWTRDEAGRAADLAERILAIPIAQGAPMARGPASSSAIQSASRDLLDAARTPPGRGMSVARQHLQRAAERLLPLAQAPGHSAPAPDRAISPVIRGAFADALSRGGSR